MGKRKKKSDIVGPVIFLIALVMLALVIIGICIDWISTKTTAVIVENTSAVTFSDLYDANQNVEIENFALMASFTLATIIASGVGVLVFGCSLVIRLKLIKLIALIAGVIAVIASIGTIITCFTFSNSYSLSIVEGLAEAVSKPAIGAWLLSIGGLLSGVCVALGAVRK